MSSTTILSLVAESVRKISAYHVQPPKGLIKMDAMENPWTMPDDLVAEWQTGLAKVAMNRYPSAEAPELKKILREVMSVPEESGILLGNGSDEIIQMLIMLIAGSGRSVMAPEPGFVMYSMICSWLGVSYHGIELNADFSLDIDHFVQQIETRDPGLIFLAVPNNPTGNLFAAEDIERIIDASNGIVVFDEAYMAFTDTDFLPYLLNNPDVLIMRTLSKIGLAGLRLGMLIGATSWINEINKIRLPYNINVLTQYSAEFALRNFDRFKEQTDLLIRNREVLFNELVKIKGSTIFPSEANFLLIRSEIVPARQLHQKLKDSGILVRLLDGGHHLLNQCIRVNVSSDEEQSVFLEALNAIIEPV